MVVAEIDRRVVGFRAFMPWTLEGDGVRLRAVRGADAVTDPGLQRSGVFGRVRRAAETLYPDPVDLYFGTPNDRSLGATMKLGGRSVAGTLHASVRIRPLRAARVLARRGQAVPSPDAAPASAALDDTAAVDALVTEAQAAERRLHTVKDSGWLRWRYGAAPLDYRALRIERGGRLDGLAIFRLRTRRGLPETVIEEMFVRPGDRRTLRLLVRGAVRAAPSALLSCEFPAHTTARAVAARHGFVRWRGGIRIVVKPVTPDISPPPERLDSWGLSLGDLEVL